MPELPEVERVRLSLTEPLIGARIAAVRVRRADVTRAGERPARPAELLRGARVAALHRHGKQLAIVAEDGRALCMGLGMTGGLLVAERAEEIRALDHAHVVWTLQRGQVPRGRTLCFMAFQDPRRFGHVTCYQSFDALRRERWSLLGPDALTITPDDLRGALVPGARSIKAALLDQRAIAGVGNIYADEALFMARLSPRRLARSLSRDENGRLADAVRDVLAAAITAGGSTIRDYRDAGGAQGSFQLSHQVYGRAGLPCIACGGTLRAMVLAQRTTVMCDRCQPVSSRGSPPNQPTYPHAPPTIQTPGRVLEVRPLASLAPEL